jgi:hypothetical protein
MSESRRKHRFMTTWRTFPGLEGPGRLWPSGMGGCPTVCTVPPTSLVRLAGSIVGSKQSLAQRLTQGQGQPRRPAAPR